MHGGQGAKANSKVWEWRSWRLFAVGCAKGPPGEGSLLVFAKLAEEDRQLRLERQRKGKEKGNDKETGKHVEELKSKVK